MLLSDAEIEDLCTAICMKPGHRKRFPVLIKREREKAEREEPRRREREEEEQEHRHRLEKSRRRRELEADQASGKTDAGTTRADNNTLTNPVDAGIVLPKSKRYGATIAVLFISS